MKFFNRLLRWFKSFRKRKTHATGSANFEKYFSKELIDSADSSIVYKNLPPRDMNVRQKAEWKKAEPLKSTDVKCVACKHRVFSDMYCECSKGYKGIVQPWDGCERGEKIEE